MADAEARATFKHLFTRRRVDERFWRLAFFSRHLRGVLPAMFSLMPTLTRAAHGVSRHDNIVWHGTPQLRPTPQHTDYSQFYLMRHGLAYIEGTFTGMKRFTVISFTLRAWRSRQARFIFTSGLARGLFMLPVCQLTMFHEGLAC